MSEALQERSLEKFINKAMPNNIQILKSLAGFSPSQPAVLLFTQKSTISLSYRILSYFYRESLGFFQVRVPDEEDEMDLSQYGVTSFPSLGVRMTDGKFVTFTGDLKNNKEIDEFLSGYGARISTHASVSNDDSASPSNNEIDAASLTTAELNSLFTTSEESAYVIAIIKESSPVPQWWTELTEKCVGAVKSGLFKCTSVDLTDVAQQLCSTLKNSESALVILPYSQSSKKKVVTISVSSLSSSPRPYLTLRNMSSRLTQPPEKLTSILP